MINRDGNALSTAEGSEIDDLATLPNDRNYLGYARQWINQPVLGVSSDVAALTYFGRPTAAATRQRAQIGQHSALPLEGVLDIATRAEAIRCERIGNGGIGYADNRPAMVYNFLEVSEATRGTAKRPQVDELVARMLFGWWLSSARYEWENQRAGNQ